MPTPENPPQTQNDGALDLGEIEPGIAAGYPRPADGAHPWSPSEFDHRANAELEAAKSEFIRLAQLEQAAYAVLISLTGLRYEAGLRVAKLAQ